MKETLPKYKPIRSWKSLPLGSLVVCIRNGGVIGCDGACRIGEWCDWPQTRMHWGNVGVVVEKYIQERSVHHGSQPNIRFFVVLTEEKLFHIGYNYYNDDLQQVIV